jgi:predicted nuclease of predicted toxin-antitoxin system
MKILFDECLPRKLKSALADHDCMTVPEASLAGQKNGRSLSLAESAGFEVFLTVDKGLSHQQNLAGRRIAIVVIRAKSNRRKDLLPVVETSRAMIRSIRPGEMIRVGE